MKEKGFLKDFWENFEEYLCSAALLVMTLVTFMTAKSPATTCRITGCPGSEV